MRGSWTLAGVLVLLLAPSHGLASKWGLNSLGDSVYWSQSIALVRVKTVEHVDSFEGKSGGKSGKARVIVQVVERWKGTLADEERICELDLGDATMNASPYPPLSSELVGQQLLVFLSAKDDQTDGYRVHNRGTVQDQAVSKLLFHGFRAEKYPLNDLRSLVAELLLIQAACPRDRHLVKSEAAALAACRVALYSKHEQVTFYGIARLFDRPVPNDFLDDLIPLAKRQKSSFPLRYGLVQVIAKVGEKKAVPDLIDILRDDPKDTYTLKALQQLTGADPGQDAQAWETWWRKHQTKP